MDNSFVYSLVIYLYFSFCLFKMAQKFNLPNLWMAWVPIADAFLFIKLAGRPLWWFILLLIPLVNIVVGVILWMDVAKKMGKPSWVGILIIVPILNFVVPGYIALYEASAPSAPSIPKTPPASF